MVFSYEVLEIIERFLHYEDLHDDQLTVDRHFLLRRHCHQPTMVKEERSFMDQIYKANLLYDQILNQSIHEDSPRFLDFLIVVDVFPRILLKKDMT